jgi:AcrR family transcriptional regulator
MDAPTQTRKDLRREKILAVASEVFFEEGYQAASMSAIAARLGGSKATLYNYFPSKEALFEAQVRDACAAVTGFMTDLPADKPVAEVLTDLGFRFMDYILSDWAVRMFQIIVAEARRTPELAEVFFAAGPLVGQERLTQFLEGAKARGRINAPDCRDAAWLFLSMCKVRHLEVVLNLTPKPSPEAIAADVAMAVDLFMTRYGMGKD